MASTTSPDRCKKALPVERINNGLGDNLNISFSSTGSCTSLELPKLELELSPRHGDTGFNETLTRYKKKMGEVKRQLSKRDELIRLLTERLEQTRQEQTQAQREASQQEQEMAREVSQLKADLQACMELLEARDPAPGQHRHHLQQMLRAKNDALEELQQKLEAQEQQIAMLQQIRTDLLSRLAAAPPATAPADQGGNLSSNIKCHVSPLVLGESKSHAAVDIRSGGCAVTLTPLSLPELSSSPPELPASMEGDENLLLGYKRVICNHLSDWITARTLPVNSFADVLAVFDDLKQFAMQGLHYAAACEAYSIAVPNPSDLLAEVAALHTQVTSLESELGKLEEQLAVVRSENGQLRRTSLATEEELKSLRTDRNLAALSSIKESEYQRAKEEVQDESLLEVYELQTECIRLEQEKKALEQQRTRLLSGEQSPSCESPVPSLLAMPDRVRHSSAVQTDDVDAVRSALESSCAALTLDKRLSFDSLDTSRDLEEPEEEKGTYDALVAENIRLAAERQRAESDLEVARERLRSAEETIDKLRAELEQEHGTLEQLVARTEEMLQGTTSTDLSSRDRRLFLENQGLKCQVTLLSSQLERERDFSQALRRHVHCLGSRDEAFQKTVKDLTNRLLSSGERLRSALDKCRQLEQALAKSAAKAKGLEAEVRRLGGSLARTASSGVLVDKSGDCGETSALAKSGKDAMQRDEVSTEVVGDCSRDWSSSSDGSTKQEMKPLAIQRMQLELEEKELLLSNQDLCSRAAQQLELCWLREELHTEYGERLSAALAALKDSCRRELLSFQECLARESSLQLLRLRESHQAEIAALKQRHAEQVEQLRAKLVPVEPKAASTAEAAAALADLRERQQAEYEQLLPQLEPELQLKLQALVALTLRIHQVENEHALASAQERLLGEKHRLWETLSSCSQVDREAQEARLELEQKAALREQYQALLEEEKGARHHREDPTEEEGPIAVAPFLNDRLGREQRTTEALFGLLQEQLDRDLHTAISKLTGEWKEKFTSGKGGPTTAASADPSEVPEEEEHVRALVHDLRKHLESAKEAEQLVQSFQRLGEALRGGLRGELERLAGAYQEMHGHMEAAAALERYRGLCEQLAPVGEGGNLPDPASLQHQQDLQLRALRASLEEQHSQEKAALLSEQVVRTKELLSKHRAELEELEKAAEVRLAEERHRLTEELEALRCKLREKEQALSHQAAQEQEEASAIAEETSSLIEKHNAELERLSFALEEEQRQTESLRQAFDTLKRERDEIIELAEGIANSGSEGTSVDPTTVIRRLAEENALLRREAETVQAELAREKEQAEVVCSEYESKLRIVLEELREAESKQRQMEEQFQEEAKLKEEELQLLKHQVEQYADSLGSQRLESDQELESLERRLEAKHAAELDALKSEHRANIEVLRESLNREVQDVRAGYEEEQRKARRNLETEHNLIANSLRAEYELAVEALKKNHSGQLEKLQEQHEREKARWEQRSEEERAIAARELKSKLEAHYTEIVETTKAEYASRARQLQAELERLEEELRLAHLEVAKRTAEAEEERANGAAASEARVKSSSQDSLDGKRPEDRNEDGESKPKNAGTTTTTENSAKDSAEWSDISVEDILYERSELMKQLRSLSGAVDKLHAEKEELQEQLRKAQDELASKEIRATSRSPSKALLLKIPPCRPFSEEKASPLSTCSGDVFCSREWLAGSGLTANEIQSWQLHTAQTNTRLLNVLSDLVKTYVDTEQEIQDALGQLGLSRVDSPASSNVAPDEDYSSLGGLSCQTQGSKEDFGEGFLSELCEDGPDLTPRTWDMFASAIGMQDTTEMEGEDVVLGASRRLRTAVDRVLRLLGEVCEHRGEDFRGLVQRNRDLCQELRQESQLHNQLALDLLHTQERVRALEADKQRLEDALSHLEEQRLELQRELRSARSRAQRLEDARESLGEQQQLLEEQRRMLREGLHEPQIPPCSTCPSEQAPTEASEGLLEEHERLREEKRRLQLSQDQERDALSSRLAELEAALEEASAQREELLEGRRLEVADLHAQIDAMDKQLLSHKKFIEEQTHEREQEREDFAHELAKMQEALKDKEKIQNCEQRLSKEIESLEQQLRMRVEDCGVVQRKREQLEAEVRSRDDKIQDLRDIIRDLEADVNDKSRSVSELTLRLSGLEAALSEARAGEQEALQELEKTRGGAQRGQSAVLEERLRRLQEQLEARTQELDKMAQMGSLLQEFRAQVRSLEEKVESRIRQVQDAHGALRQLVQSLSPPAGGGSASASPSASREAVLPASGAASSEDSCSSSSSHSLSVVAAGRGRPLSADDIRDALSPSALQWEELRGLEEKVDALVAAVGDTFQENVQLRRALKTARRDKEELEREKRALQELSQQQLLQVSALKAHVEDARLGLAPAGTGGGPVGQQLQKLRHDLLKEKEAREEAEHQLQLSTDKTTSLLGQLRAQREVVASLRGQPRPLHHVGTLTRDLSPPHAQHKKPVCTRATATELSLPQLLVLEAAQQKVRALEQSAQLEAACSAQQEQDVAELQAMLQERDEEIEALHQAVETQVSPLRDKVCSLQEELVSRERAWSEQRERLKQELARARESYEVDVKRLRLRLHESQQLNEKAQEALRAELLTLRETLSRSVPREEASSALQQAVSAEREQQQSRHHEEIRLLEETWRARMEAQRLRMEQQQQQSPASRLRSWNRTDLEKEMASYLEQETAAMGARHQSTVESLRQQFDEEKRHLRQVHADELQRSLETLRTALVKDHADEVASLKESAEAEKAQWQHAAETRPEQHDAWQQTDPPAAELWTREEISSLVGRRIEEEVDRLRSLHEAEVAELKKAVDRNTRTPAKERQASSGGLSSRMVELEAEVSRLRGRLSEALREQERAGALEAGFERERAELEASLRRAQAEGAQRDEAHREQLRRTEATLRAQMETEKGRLLLQQEQLAWRLREEHAQQTQALREEHLREVEALQHELDGAKMKLRAHRMSALVRSSRGDTPSSDNGSLSSSASASTMEEAASSDSILSPQLRELLAKIYREGLHVLSLTERQLLQRHLTPPPEHSDGTAADSSASTVNSAQMAGPTAEEFQQLHDTLLKERLAHKQELDEVAERMKLSREQQDQRELKLRAKVETLEGQVRQERGRWEELKQRADGEQAKTLELLTQLNSQRSQCLELEMALANCRADLADARRQALAHKQEALHCRSSLEVEKLHAQNMLNAVNAERAHFNQLQATLELERCRGALTHEQDLRVIRELTASSSACSTPRQQQLSDIEKMRGGLPSGTTHAEGAFLGDEDDAASATGGSHFRCDREKLTLSQSLLRAEEEISRLRQLALSQDLLGRPAAPSESDEPPASMCRLLHCLYWKYRKADSCRKALVYQKQYLLSLLQGFQATEDMALRMLATRRPPPSPPALLHMDSSEDDGVPHFRNHQGFRLHSSTAGRGYFQHLLAYQHPRGARQDSVEEAPLPSGSSSHSSADGGSSGFASSLPPSPRFRFRSAVQALVALHRMQHLVQKWRLAACIPPTPVLMHKVELAVRSVPAGGPWKLGSSANSPMGTARSSQSSVLSASTSQASATTVLSRRLPLPPSPRTPVRPGSTPRPVGMRQFVERLDNLHKQLGLTDDPC
ncbi:uncharacterized protein LOC144169219 isoform X3 [Haemaphysalis longicornis]